MDDDRNDVVSTRLRPLEDAVPPDLWPRIVDRSEREEVRVRRRPGARVAVVVAAVGVLAAAGIAAWPDDGGRATHVVVGSTATTTPPDGGSTDGTSGAVSTTELPLLDHPVPLDLLMLHPNGAQVAVADLEERVIRSYERASGGGVSGAVITATGDALIWIRNEIYVFTDADFARRPTVIRPRIGVDRSLHAPGTAGEQHVIPTADGREVWVVMIAAVIASDDTLVERIDLTSGATTLSSSILGIDASPVAATDTHLVLNAPRGSDTPSVLVMDARGSTTDLGPGTAIAASDGRVAVLRHDGELVIIGVDGTDEVLVQRPEDGAEWIPTGHSPSVGVSPPARSVTADGRLLMAMSTEDDVNGVPLALRLYSVNVFDGTVERFGEVQGAPFAIWSRTGEHIVLMQDRRVSVLSVGSPGDGPREVASLPPDTWLFAAG